MTSTRVSRSHVRLAFVATAALLASACGSSGSGAGDESADPPAPTDAPAAAPNDAPETAESEGLEDAADGGLPTAAFTMPDGSTATFADFLADGKPLVINYFASWCAPCRAEMPDFAAVHDDVGDQVAYLGMAIQDRTDAAADLVELTGVQYPWGEDQNGALYVELGGFAMPTTWYVSPDGAIVGQDNGQIDEDILRSRMQELFGVEA